MRDEARFHIVSIPPLEQAALRIALRESFRRDCLALLADSKERTPAEVDRRIRRFEEYFENYDESVEGLPGVKRVGSGDKTKMFRLSKPTMDRAVRAAQEVTSARLSAMEEELVDRYAPALVDRLQEAQQFMYTMAEFKKASGEK